MAKRRTRGKRSHKKRSHVSKQRRQTLKRRKRTGGKKRQRGGFSNLTKKQKRTGLILLKHLGTIYKRRAQRFKERSQQLKPWERKKFRRIKKFAKNYSNFFGMKLLRPFASMVPT